MLWFEVAARAGTVTLASDGSTFDTLQSAIDAAPSGDTLTLSGAFDEPAWLPKDLTLVGDGTAVLSNADTWALYIEAVSVTLESLTFTAQLYNGGDLVMRDCDIFGMSSGGTSLWVEDATVTGTNAVLIDAGTATLTSVTFDHVSTLFFLRPLDVRGDAQVTCDRCTFDGTTPGAASSYSTAGLTLIDSEFLDVTGATPIFVNAGPLVLLRTRVFGSDDYGILGAHSGSLTNVGVWDATSAGAYLSGDGPWEVTNCAFSGPSSHLTLQSPATTVRNTSFEDTVVSDVYGYTFEYVASNGNVLWGGTGNLSNAAMALDADGLPAPWSPLVDAGDPALLDLDGSVSDIGLYGGPSADPAAWADLDGDGVGAPDDCDDTTASVGRATPQHPDRDGDGHASVTPEPACPDFGWADTGDDCDDADPATWAPFTWYADADIDGYGDLAAPEEACTQPEGMSANPDDCDDHDPTVSAASSGYVDGDLDGVGAGAEQVECTATPTLVARDGDCDDQDPGIVPGSEELCDGVDQNCVDGIDDEGRLTLYVDADGDGFGDPGTGELRCELEAGWVSVGTDCDDAEDSAFPGGLEVCDGVDNDCDGGADDGIDCNGACDGSSVGDPPGLWYADEDGDGAGDPATETFTACPPPGWVAVAGDCDDADPSLHPAAPEVAGDGEDQDCDGKDEGVYAGSCACAGAPDRGAALVPLAVAAALLVRRRTAVRRGAVA
ncbi:MAG: putative metal-binding motif-containing protein [Myxococcota bacterium]